MCLTGVDYFSTLGYQRPLEMSVSPIARTSHVVGHRTGNDITLASGSRSVDRSPRSMDVRLHYAGVRVHDGGNRDRKA